MDSDYFQLAMRWLHILAVVTAVGGTIFMRFALLPSIEHLPPDQRKALQQGVRSRWAKLVMLSIGLLLISGLFSYLTIRQRFIAFGPNQKVPALYNALFGVKFLLALAIFFIASALAGRSPALERFRDNARYWMNVNLILAVLVICISGILRATHMYPNPDDTVMSVPSVELRVADTQ